MYGASSVTRQLLKQVCAVCRNRQAIQPRPDAARRPPLQPDPLVLIHRQQQPPGFRCALEFARAHGIPLRVTVTPGHTYRVQWADHTPGLARQAYRGAQVHQALRVAGHGGGQSCARQQLGGLRPQIPLMGQYSQVGIKAQHTAQHPFHVGVQDGSTFAITKGRNGRRRGPAYARQGLQHLRRPWKRTLV